MSILNTLRSRFQTALAPLVDDVVPLLDMIRPSTDPKFGDFQANCAMPLRAVLNKPPRDIAADIVASLNVDDLCEPPEIAGPGFINLRLKDEWIQQQINSITQDERLGVQPAANPKHVVVDFSSPNVAKPMHVGHLRSTVIGDALCRTLRFAGHRVTSDNHIGDWGTQFGMIIFGYRNFVDESAYRKDAVAELARLYKLVNQLSDYHDAGAKLPQLSTELTTKRSELQRQEAAIDPSDRKAKKNLKALQKQITELEDSISSATAKIAAVDADPALKASADAHPDIARQARVETSKLHAGDPDNQNLWDQFLPACLKALDHIYDRLHISFDLALGESFYNPMLADVVESLKQKNLAKESAGATCVFIEGNDAPFIVQKSDLAYTYATSDLATIRYRVDQLAADELVYVVDKRQSEHFQLLFQTAALWGYTGLPCRHVSFGTVMGENGKPLKTRSGENISLENLIDEAIARARRIVNENDDNRDEPLLSEDQRARVAEIVGVGGIKYADLRHNRDSDYIFDWDKMLATSGDTATYMQYAYARICGIFRKLNVDRETLRTSGEKILLTAPEERSLILQLLRFDEAISAVLSDYRPNQLTAWLFETADRFSAFYNTCSVQAAESGAIRTSRLLLCDLMARALKTGLSLLGIETAEVM
ncbi:MAG: arginine--tRNA ligase [Planctomycetaceae bacterium]